jgi:hypothetical protein
MIGAAARRTPSHRAGTSDRHASGSSADAPSTFAVPGLQSTNDER